MGANKTSNIEKFWPTAQCGRLERFLPLNGQLELPKEQSAPAFLCLTHTEVWLAAAESTDVARAIPLSSSPTLRYETHPLGDRLLVDNKPFGIPFGKGDLARELLAFGRVRALNPAPSRDPSRDVVPPGHFGDPAEALSRAQGSETAGLAPAGQQERETAPQFQGLFCEEIKPLAREWLSCTLDADEELLVWLETSSDTSFENSHISGATGKWHYLLTDRCSCLVAFSPVGEVKVEVLPHEALQITQSIGRDTVKVGDRTWLTAFMNDSSFLRIRHIPGLPGHERILETARLHWLARATSPKNADVARRLLEAAPSPTALTLLLKLLVSAEGDEKDRARVDAESTLPELEEVLSPRAPVWPSTPSLESTLPELEEVLSPRAHVWPSTPSLESTIPELEEVLSQLQLEQPDSTALAEALNTWGFLNKQGPTLLQALLTLAPASEGAHWALPLHKALCTRLLTNTKDLEERIDMEIDLAAHLLCAEERNESIVLLERLRSELPDEQLLDLLPPAGEELLAGGSFRLRRIRILELLARARGGGDEATDAEMLRELARLQPLNLDQVRNLVQGSSGELRERASELLSVLEPGGLERPESSASSALEPYSSGLEAQAIPPEVINTRIVHPIAQRVGWLESLKKLVATSPRSHADTLRSFCERAGQGHKDTLLRSTSRAALALGIPSMEVYISRGERKLGIVAHDASPPILLVGGAHLDPEHDSYLDPNALQFAVASEAAHIRMKHKRVTPEDVRNGLFDKSGSFLAFSSTALQLVPATALASYLGKKKTYAIVRRIVPIETLKKIMKVQDGRKLVSSVSPSLDSLVKAGASGLSGLGSNVKKLKASTNELASATDLHEQSTPEKSVGVAHRRLIDPCRVMFYTADRAGLVLCGSLASSIRAIYLTAPEYRSEFPLAREFGLARALSRRDADGKLVHEELVLRICALASFYLSDDYRVARAALAAQDREGK